MKKKLLFVLGAAVGYVVGTRTGRKGYEKLKDQVGEVWQKPAVQDGIVRAELFAEEKIPVVGHTVSAAVQTAADSVTNAVKKNDESSSSDAIDSHDSPDGSANTPSA
jgi:FMN-dependent NADH-azoreductase